MREPRTWRVTGLTARPPPNRSLPPRRSTYLRGARHGARSRINDGDQFPERRCRGSPICAEPSPGRPGFLPSRTAMAMPHLEPVPADLIPEDGATDVVVAPLLDLDPSLAGDLTPALREQVRGWLVVRVLTLPRGPWPASADREPGLMGFLVLDGVLTRNVSLGRIAYPELLGRGDLLRPWQTETDGRLGPVQVTWQVLEPCRVAVLDRRFAGI